jgi:FkbM family methyltransferase
MEIYEASELRFYIRGDWDRYVVQEEIRDDYYRIPKNIKIAIDIGAHIGGTTIKMARMGTEVYAYEPLKENFDLLMENIELNNVGHKVHAFNLGIGTPGERTLFINKENTGMNSFASQIDRVAQRPDNQIAKCISLEEAMKDIKYCDFIKFDCEGGEYEFIPQLTKELADRIGAWSGEVHFDDHPAIINSLKRFYQVDGIPSLNDVVSNRLIFAKKFISI